MIRAPRNIALALACLVLAACPEDETTNPTTTTATDASTPTDLTGFTTTDSSANETVDTSVTETSAPDAGEFEAACLGNENCDSGWCVEGEIGYQCTRECIDECEEGYDCRSVQVVGDIVFLCLPRVVKLCTSCLEDFQCNGGGCVDIAGEQRCATQCEDSTECVPGYECKEAGPADQGTWCLPISGSCDCSPPFEGIARPCTNGECRGTEVCDPLVGWTGCTAPEPSGELCNYVDDDCDTEVDESFKTNGLYLTGRACGGCDIDCDDVLPNTTETTCVEVDGLARCQVVECEQGYQQLSPYICAPDLGGCIPCTDVAECVGTNASCTQLTDGEYCTFPCEEDDDCSDGFVCQDVPESDFDQCVPESGSCTCDGTNTDLSRSCTETFTPPEPDAPTTTCRGIEQCTASGWGGCELPSEACDGIDEDCDGVIDGPFKTGDKYTALLHCGACGVSCTAFGGPNATPTCNAAPAVPQCGYTCINNAVDVNGIAEDGCECIPVGGPDLAGDSVDSNCDGIDGEVNNGIFVSKNGDDLNPGTRELPVLTIAAGITKAKAQLKRDTYVATGVYSENVILLDGVGVFGGYAPFYDEHDTTLYEVAIVGQAPDATHLGTVTAVNVGTTPGGAETVLDGFTVFGINAANLAGQNSYAIYVNGSGSRLRLSKNRIFAGPGGSGTSGGSGTDGSSGVPGGEGADAQNLTSTCSSGATSGGSGGVRMCGATNVSGGVGGSANCPDWDDAPTASQSGVVGQGTTPGGGGDAGWDWLICAEASCGTVACDLCQFPQGDNRATGEQGDNGFDGLDGDAGTGCQNATGSVVNGHWQTTIGGNGGDGGAGAGGGGGGAGGGVEVRGNMCTGVASDDDLGGAGGGGGSGGCGALGGSGGTGGGGSFGIFLVLGSSTPTLTGNTIQGGRGGQGGNGGLAGVGGLPGFGGEGGASGDTFGDVRLRCASGGGNGGNGGAGGHGGGGGGGCGGSAFGIYATGTPPAAWKTLNTYVPGGVGGERGRGGASLEPDSKGRDGSDGFSVYANF